MKRTGRSYVATAVALGIITLSGCAADTTGTEDKVPAHEDWGDETKYPELGGAFAALTAPDADSITVGTGVDAGKLTIVLNDTAQTLVLGVRPVDLQILVNGAVATGTKGLTSKTLKTVSVSVVGSGTTAVQNVVLDLLGGVFAPGIKLTGTAATPGITIDLGGTTGDTVALRGSVKPDLFAVGAGSAALSNSKALVGFNNDAFPDVLLKNDVSLTFSLAAGADTFTAEPVVAQNLGGVYTRAVTVFGGGDADKLTGGSAADVVRGGDGNDIIVGGLGNDVMYGDGGDDVFTAAAVTDGSDIFDCGASTVVGDKVSYELRAANKPVRVSLEPVADLGADLVLGTADDVKDLGADTALGGTGANADVLLVANDGELGLAADGTDGEQDNVLTGCENVVGGKGNDRLYGDLNKNVLTGGEGDDLLQGGLEADSHKGGAGVDTVDYSDRSATVTVVLATGTTPTVANGVGSENDSIDGDVENVKGGTGDDTLTGNALANEFWGDLGDDVLNGGDGDDIFHEDMLLGDDGAIGGTGGDADTEDTGADEFNGGAGVDTVDYSQRVSGVWVTAAGTAAAAAAAGDDGLSTFSATVTMLNVASVTSTNVEDDNVWANVENIVGGAGADHLVGDKTASNITANTIDGGAGIDYIDGGEGDDTLSGGADDDHILGGLGDDTVEGGAGSGNKLDCGDGDDLAFSGDELTVGAVTCELLF